MKKQLHHESTYDSVQASGGENTRLSVYYHIIPKKCIYLDIFL